MKLSYYQRYDFVDAPEYFPDIVLEYTPTSLILYDYSLEYTAYYYGTDFSVDISTGAVSGGTLTSYAVAQSGAPLFAATELNLDLNTFFELDINPNKLPVAESLLAGNDEITGSTDHDVLLGLAGDDVLVGGEGDDVIAGGEGDDQLDGGTDIDVAVFSGAYAEYSISQSGELLILDGPDGNDSLENIEYLYFDDGLYSVIDLSDDSVTNKPPTGTVIISGTPSEGETLTASNSLDDEDGLGIISYQWQADGVDIDGAVTDELLLTADEVGSNITVVASYTDDLGTAESEISLPTDVVTTTTTGAVIDGYVSGASIYVDANDNGIADPEEYTGIDTDQNGNFEIDTVLQGSIIAVGGTNVDTGLPNSLILTAPEGSSVVTPITTLIDTYADSEGVSSIDAESKVQSALGIQDDIDLTQYDPLSEDTVTSVEVHAAAVQIATLGILANDAGSSFDEVLSALASSAADGETLALSDGDYLADNLSGVLGSNELVQAVETNTALAEAEDLDDIVDVQQGLGNTSPEGTVSVLGGVEAGAQLGINNTLTDADGLGHFSYQWLVDGVNVDGAIGEFFTPDAEQAKQQISVRVSYTDSKGTLETITSGNATATISVLIAEQPYETIIQGAYVAFYGRPADPGGLTAWAELLANNGGDLSAIIEAFGNSVEYTERYGHLSNRELVNEIYLQCFNRPAEELGLNAWADHLDKGLISVQHFALAVLMGARNNDAVTIMNKIGFAEDFTESVSQGFAEYKGSEQANAIKAIMLNVSHESSDSDFPDLINGYVSQYAPADQTDDGAAQDDIENYYTVDLSSLSQSVSMDETDVVFESLIPTSINIQTDGEAGETDDYSFLFSVDADVEELITASSDQDVSSSLIYSLGFDLDGDDSSDIFMAVEIASGERQGNSLDFEPDLYGHLLYLDHTESENFVGGFMSGFYSEGPSMAQNTALGTNFVSAQFYMVNAFNQDASEYVRNAPGASYIQTDGTYSYEEQFNLMAGNYEALLPTMLNTVDVFYREIELDPLTDEPVVTHDGYVQYQVDAGDILFV